ncbi:MAG: bacteriohopanetetrol glucosamine biosynthesis glycosyltransferase HpnI [Bryobacteraceae bacterium]
MIYLLLTLGVAATVYQALALAGALRRLAAREPEPRRLPPVSILKPVCGLDPEFYENVRSHALQNYPQYELVFGVSDPADPAVAEIERLQAEYPAVAIRLVHSTTQASNGKVGVLADLAAAARHSLLLVNDSDIRVPPDYLARVVAPLEDERTGVVTCLYRGRPASLAGRFEAVGIATDFMPSVLAAPLVGVSEFALGSTLVFRRADLERIGGFGAIADYIADDYQLSRRITALGRRVAVSSCVVETWLPETTWAGVWRHQLRWARTIRLSRGGGYAGLPLANATLWAVLLAAAGLWWAALALFALRLAAGLTTAAGVLHDRAALRDAWMIPLRDLAGLALWAGGLFGSEVLWRGLRLKLDREGRIVGVKDSLRTEDYFRERAARGSVAKAKRALKRAGKGNPPQPGDEI